MTGHLRRREFMTLLSGAAAWPLVAHAQQGDQVRRIGVLMNRAPDAPEGQARLAAFQRGLKDLGWTEGHNVRIETRFGADDFDLERKYALELVGLAPDVILASGTLSVAALQRASRALPIVFTAVTDPVGAGFVERLARPGGNATGFMIYEYSLSGKWLELLRQIVPNLTRVAVVRNPDNPAGVAVFGAVQSAAQPLGIEVSAFGIRDAGEIERQIAAFARAPNGGLIVSPTASSNFRELIVTFAAQHKLPAVYSLDYDARGGGLVSYGPDIVDQFRVAAVYVDRVLKGEKPAELPVQAPTKYKLVINLKAAKALGLDLPATLLATADAVIE